MKYKKNIGLFLLGVGFLFCVLQHLFMINELEQKGKKVILIAHWQGERGCKEALQKVIDEYNEQHPDVHVRQQIIVGMGSSFVRWCVTQIIGGTPPEIMEYHNGFKSYLGDYFVGLSQYVDKPNPYNNKSDYKDILWKDTFYGGMFTNWEPELMDYYSIPNTLYTQRFYYNKDIFKKATGSSEAPKTVEEFIEICKKIEKLGITPVIVENAKGRQGLEFFNRTLTQLSWNFEQELDYNHDGEIQQCEFLRGYYIDDFNFSEERIQATLKVLKLFSKSWVKGFNGIDKTVAPFMFIQGRGACYYGGSWLGRQMLDSCKFELGYFPYPLISKKNKIAGKYYCGPWGENATPPGMALAVANTPNKDIAIDFLRFLTTKKNNSTFNKGPAWVPGVIGAEVDPAVKDFEPLIRGKSVKLGFQTRSIVIELKRILQNFLGGTYSEKETISELDRTYNSVGLKNNERSSRSATRRLIKSEELRYNIEQELWLSESKKDKEQLSKMLLKIYETQIYGLNQVYSVHGITKYNKKKKE